MCIIFIHTGLEYVDLDVIIRRAGHWGCGSMVFAENWPPFFCMQIPKGPKKGKFGGFALGEKIREYFLAAKRSTFLGH